MKKVGIVTIIDYLNYGNRLQNYATQQVLVSLGCEAETIINYPKKKGLDKPLSTPERIKKLFSQPLPEIWAKIMAKLGEGKRNQRLAALKPAKEKAFRSFTNKHIHESTFAIEADNLPPELSGRYDYCLTGSDQIWNPNFRRGTKSDFLFFMPPEKRIAFAPSFGISRLPLVYEGLYRELISQMGFLSVRERAGADIINDLTGRQAEVLVDPTLLISAHDWKQISQPSGEKPAGDYLLTYFLGEPPADGEKVIKKLLKTEAMTTVRIASLRDAGNYSAGPAEFLDYIKDCRVFFTDSFHGVVFSILFEKPFVVFDRKGKSPSMGSRLDNLLTLFHLQERRWARVKDSGRFLEADFSHIAPVLEKEREKSLGYLRKALGIPLSA